MKKTRVSLALLARVVLIWAPVAFAPSVTCGRELPQPASWMPASATRIVFLDWTSLLSNPSLSELETIVKRQDSWPQLEEFRELTGMDPWTDIWALCAFRTSSESKTSWGLAAHGAFDRTRAIETLESGRAVERNEYQDTDLYIIGSDSPSPRFGEERAALAFPDDTTLLYGPESQVRAMLDAGLGFSPPVTSGPLAPRLNETRTGETFWAVGRDETRLSGSADVPLFRRLPPLQSFSLWARFGTVVSIAARGETLSPEQASAFADVLRGMKALNLLHPKGGQPLQSILGSLEIETLDEVVEISLEIDGKGLRDLLSQRGASERDSGRPAR